MNLDQEIIYSIALTHLPRIGLVSAKRLYEEAGSATAIFENRGQLRNLFPDATPQLIQAFTNCDEALRLGEKELRYIQDKRIKAFCMNDSRYPKRLLHCNDAPVILFYYGNANLNSRKIISIVGTRKCTQYGKDICRNFISDLRDRLQSSHQPPGDTELLIVSGLAYGIDIHAHRESLANGIPTVGVLAHGLDRIYPAMHRKTAAEMVQEDHGGLLTEYLTGTRPEKINFIRRNRIVAGIADATIVVESANHGGALITAELASSYNRDVFAFPGRIYDSYSEGCNNLIARQSATMAVNADSFLESMGWESKVEKPKASVVQTELFPSLTPEETKIVSTLQNCDQKQINQIVIESNLPFHVVSSCLYELEYKGIVLLLGGARYKLLNANLAVH